MADNISLASDDFSVASDEVSLAVEFPAADAEPLGEFGGDATPDYDLTGVDSFTVINGAVFTDAQNVGSGTGGYNTFLAVHDQTGGEVPQDSYEIAFNSNDTNPLNETNDEIDPSKTETIRLSDLVQVTVDGVAYYQFRVDLNESNNDVLISLDQFKLFASTDSTIESTTVLFAQRLLYDMDAGGNVDILLKDVSSGSGTDDYAVLVPVSNFVDANGAPLNPTTSFIYLYVQMGAAGGDYDAEGGFEEWNIENGVTLSGTKFEDENGNGILDSGEGPIAGIKMFIDADKDGSFDTGERFTFTDAQGNYSFFGVALNQTVWIDEDLAGSIDPDGAGGIDPTQYVQTTGDHEVVVIPENATPGSTITVDPIGNFIPRPELNIVKDVASITGGVGTNGLTGADGAGDTINYTISVQNTGNVSLTGVTVTDPNADAGSITRIADLVGDNDAILEVGETWRYTATHTVTQGELDNNGGGDGDVDNIATADSNETGPDTDPAEAPLIRDISVDLTKYVSVAPTTNPPLAGDPSWDNADAEWGPNNVNVGDPVYFKVTVTNDGNVTLTNISITDVNTSGGGNTTVTLYSTGTGLLAGVTLTGDTGGDFVLGVGETWTLIYTQPFDAGNHVNTAYVTTTQGALDNDAAHYFSLVNEGPGVRTPGFWSNWQDFWDGDSGIPTQGQNGDPCFADHDLLYPVVDTDGDGDVDGSDGAPLNGLLIGDYDMDGITDADEDTIFISYQDALRLINASNKDMQDGVIKVGRDMVATWLNYLAGNNIDPLSPGDDESPRAYLDAAIDWMQTFGDVDNSNATGNTYDPNEDFDTYSSLHRAVKTGTGFWTNDFGGTDFSGADMHGALDYYNNTGMTSPTSGIYAHDCDDSAFVAAITAYTTGQSISIL